MGGFLYQIHTLHLCVALNLGVSIHGRAKNFQQIYRVFLLVGIINAKRSKKRQKTFSIFIYVCFFLSRLNKVGIKNNMLLTVT